MMMHQELSLEDCDELLKFPFHQYADEIKQEIDCDLPVLGDAGKLVIYGFQVEKHDSGKGNLIFIYYKIKLYRAQIGRRKFKDVPDKKNVKTYFFACCPYFRDNRGMV
ncbi:hypothetical protein CEXT_670251 [Caerostris extrusa]|uniref:Uncharacterized protein n=1 Tax=Caerostris extrusa TaxID=172846 RepID=A0AAV4QEH1_CAEEX|nr:hypothetical protein CEXT_670251 [Caerostris extrusa]